MFFAHDVAALAPLLFSGLSCVAAAQPNTATLHPIECPGNAQDDEPVGQAGPAAVDPTGWLQAWAAAYEGEEEAVRPPRDEAAAKAVLCRDCSGGGPWVIGLPPEGGAGFGVARRTQSGIVASGRIASVLDGQCPSSLTEPQLEAVGDVLVLETTLGIGTRAYDCSEAEYETMVAEAIAAEGPDHEEPGYGMACGTCTVEALECLLILDARTLEVISERGTCEY